VAQRERVAKLAVGGYTLKKGKRSSEEMEKRLLVEEPKATWKTRPQGGERKVDFAWQKNCTSHEPNNKVEGAICRDGWTPIKKVQRGGASPGGGQQELPIRPGGGEGRRPAGGGIELTDAERGGRKGVDRKKIPQRECRKKKEGKR